MGFQLVCKDNRVGQGLDWSYLLGKHWQRSIEPRLLAATGQLRHANVGLRFQQGLRRILQAIVVDTLWLAVGNTILQWSRI